MLKMKTECELCAGALAGDDQAWICSYECTYCTDCEVPSMPAPIAGASWCLAHGAPPERPRSPRGCRRASRDGSVVDVTDKSI